MRSWECEMAFHFSLFTFHYSLSCTFASSLFVKIQEFLSLYGDSEQVRKIAGKLDPKIPVKLRLAGLLGSSQPVIAASLYELLLRPMLFIFSSDEEARYFFSDLESLLPGRPVFYYPSSLKRSFVPASVDNNLVLERAEVLNRLIRRGAQTELIVTTHTALAEKVISQDHLQKNTYALKAGDPFDLEFFIEFLSLHRFERVDFVYEAGQFSIRGGIIDVYSFSNDLPYRVELNG